MDPTKIRGLLRQGRKTHAQASRLSAGFGTREPQAAVAALVWQLLDHGKADLARVVVEHGDWMLKVDPHSVVTGHARHAADEMLLGLVEAVIGAQRLRMDIDDEAQRQVDLERSGMSLVLQQAMARMIRVERTLSEALTLVWQLHEMVFPGGAEDLPGVKKKEIQTGAGEDLEGPTPATALAPAPAPDLRSKPGSRTRSRKPARGDGGSL